MKLNLIQNLLKNHRFQLYYLLWNPALLNCKAYRREVHKYPHYRSLNVNVNSDKVQIWKVKVKVKIGQVKVRMKKVIAKSKMVKVRVTMDKINQIKVKIEKS